MAKTSQKGPLEISIHWQYLYQDAGDKFSRNSKDEIIWEVL